MSVVAEIIAIGQTGGVGVVNLETWKSFVVQQHQEVQKSNS